MKNMKISIKHFLLLFALVSCAFAEDYSPDINRIMSRGKLVIRHVFRGCFTFFMHDKNNKFYGFDVDLATDIGKRLGFRLI